MAQTSAARAAGLVATAPIWLVAPAPSHGLITTATIQGTVTDAGGVLPGATVTAHELD